MRLADLAPEQREKMLDIMREHALQLVNEVEHIVRIPPNRISRSSEMARITVRYT
ncbi:hypothetical protein [Methylosinus sp. Sm6]|uniref:hypothetical protein n=1 Tax=Methylosinus sp. Sm6 TaxID=2866948 RepID=UPI001C996523|nr:hypothetical protein [Methylosinus sp. Sm6]MBY6240650.1 hypothetical protein [Methylosinus sp. Sm6]